MTISAAQGAGGWEAMCAGGFTVEGSTSCGPAAIGADGTFTAIPSSSVTSKDHVGAALNMACDAVGVSGAPEGIAAITMCGGTDMHPHVAAVSQGCQDSGVSGAVPAYETPTIQVTGAAPQKPGIDGITH